MKRRFQDKRPTLADLQTAMNYGRPAEGFAHKPSFMDKTPRAAPKQPRQHEEHDSQGQIVTYLRQCCPDVTVAASLNGELRPTGDMGRFYGWIAKLKARGMLSGDPDLRLTWFPRRCIFIEKKREKGGKLGDAQITVGDKLRAQGFHVYVMEGGIEQMREIIRLENIPTLDHDASSSAGKDGA